MQRQNLKDDSEHRNALNADTNNSPATGSIPFVKPIHAIDPCARNTSFAIVRIQWLQLHSMLMTSSYVFMSCDDHRRSVDEVLTAEARCINATTLYTDSNAMLYERSDILAYTLLKSTYRMCLQ